MVVPRPPAAAVPAKAAASAPAPRAWALGVRAGAWLPFQELDFGVIAGAQAEYVLPLWERRLRLSLFLGAQHAQATRARLQVGRGLDPALSQTLLASTVGLTLYYELLRLGAGAVEFGIGGAGTYVRSDFIAFSQRTLEEGAGGIASGALRFRHPLPVGTAGIALEAQYGAAALGVLGGVAADQLSGINLTADYLFQF